MMLFKSLPDPREAAARQAGAILANPAYALETPIDRVLGDAPWIDRRALVEGVVRFHRERMERVPDPSKYPESPPWVDYVRAVDRHLVERTGITGEQLAVLRSLGEFVAFRSRGIAPARPPSVEKCRAIFLPESDHGAIVAKNIDDPSAHWKPYPPPGAMPYGPLGFEGVGSGLHFDDEPEEIFPLVPREMLLHYCDDVPGAVEFLRRYSPFWGRQNLLLFDAQKRSVAIEKCSFNHFEVFEPDAFGRSIVSGMVCRDPDSSQGRHQAATRRLALEISGRTPDGSPEVAFWSACEAMHAKLRDALTAWGPSARLGEVVELFTTPWPAGLNKENLRVHPEQGADEWTLATMLTLRDECRVLRWQRREQDLAWPAMPEEFCFAELPPPAASRS